MLAKRIPGIARDVIEQQVYQAPNLVELVLGSVNVEPSQTVAKHRGGHGGFVPSVPSAGARPSLPEPHQASQALPQAGVLTHPMPRVIPAEVTQSEGSSSVKR
ncbi:hypothetical protein POM88_042919 [Heracleum sosnowskyi]|uniref:Argonaut glycine-rich domain-containing protein n=1 Tax=Heracleum sosnowskyi TaxID=360622 RepID=A0AAD8HIJ6_9APIA|nr:hypothetical protein POM88_042919 [Heracleum sosnowskyi]